MRGWQQAQVGGGGCSVEEAASVQGEGWEEPRVPGSQHLGGKEKMPEGDLGRLLNFRGWAPPRPISTTGAGDRAVLVREGPGVEAYC